MICSSEEFGCHSTLKYRLRKYTWHIYAPLCSQMTHRHSVVASVIKKVQMKWYKVLPSNFLQIFHDIGHDFLHGTLITKVSCGLYQKPICPLRVNTCHAGPVYIRETQNLIMITDATAPGRCRAINDHNAFHV